MPIIIGNTSSIPVHFPAMLVYRRVRVNILFPPKIDGRHMGWFGTPVLIGVFFTLFWRGPVSPQNRRHSQVPGIYIYITLFCWGPTYESFFSPKQIPDDVFPSCQKRRLDNLTVTDGTLLKVKCWKGWSGAPSWESVIFPPLKSKMTGKSTMHEDVWILLNMGDFRNFMLVFRGCFLHQAPSYIWRLFLNKTI